MLQQLDFCSHQISLHRYCHGLQYSRLPNSDLEFGTINICQTPSGVNNEQSLILSLWPAGPVLEDHCKCPAYSLLEFVKWLIINEHRGALVLLSKCKEYFGFSLDSAILAKCIGSRCISDNVLDATLRVTGRVICNRTVIQIVNLGASELIIIT
jgi:hypothetical protein